MSKQLPEKSPQTRWVQTERAAHEAWAALLRQSPKAGELLHVLIARMGEHNAVVISQKTLAEIVGRSQRTISRAVKDLVDGNWIEVRQVGERGTVNAYVINDRVAWHGPRDGMRYSLFSASVVISEDEQPSEPSSEPLRRIPSLFPGERQLPVGEGLEPPSEPDLPGFEVDLPAKTE